MKGSRLARRSFDPHQVLDAIARGEAVGADLAITIDRDGNWFYQESKIERPELVQLFASVLHRGDDGSYWLITPVERGRVLVEDVPFTAVELSAEGAGEMQRLRLRTNIGEWLPFDDGHPLRTRETSAGSTPYIRVHRGLEARLLPSLFYHLVDLGQPSPDDPASFGVWSHGRFRVLGSLGETDDVG